MTTTPSPSAPQEVPQWAKQAQEEYTDLWNKAYDQRKVGFVNPDPYPVMADVFARHAQPALDAAREEVERLTNLLKSAELYASDFRKERDALRTQLAQHKAWGERAREELAHVVEFLEECETAEDRSNLDGDDADTVLCQINDGAEHGLKAVKALLAAHPEANEGEKP